MQSSIRYIRKELQNLYTPAETGELIKLIFSDLRGFSYTDLILKAEVTLNPEEHDRIYAIVSRLKEYEPIQYVLGHTGFCDLDLTVNHTVLIPRPETGELVQWIVSGQQWPPGKILDIGTGSGCIALGLKKKFTDSAISGCDISEEAITVALENGRRNGLDVRFFTADILHWDNFNGWEPVDLIVSNPPYVRRNEMQNMKRNVLHFEPPLALFVPDEDPLLFYRKIVGFSQKWLIPEGQLYFEVNENYGAEVADLISSNGFSTVEIRQDLQGKERMIRGKKE